MLLYLEALCLILDVVLRLPWSLTKLLRDVWGA